MRQPYAEMFSIDLFLYSRYKRYPCEIAGFALADFVGRLEPPSAPGLADRGSESATGGSSGSLRPNSGVISPRRANCRVTRRSQALLSNHQ